MSAPSTRLPFIESEVNVVIRNLSGRELGPADTQATFFDLGFDSLLLTQASQALRQKFGVKLTFRQLMENLVTIAAVAGYLDEQLPPDKFTGAPAPEQKRERVVAPAMSARSAATPVATNGTGGDLVDRVVKQQLALMNQQLDLLRTSGREGDVAGVQAMAGSVARRSTATAADGETLPPFAVPDSSKSASSDQPARFFGPYKPLDRSPGGGLTPLQQEHLDNLIAAYVARTPRSKAYTQRHRAHFADPRTISGFRQQWKEMVYPVVVKHSHGSRFWDLDNNEYIDLTMGFGTNLFGHSPEFIARAMSNQLYHGIEVGPQSPIAGKVASLLCELSGQERAAFCSSGSEAVLAAVRLARTVTGRTRIATTSGYHGINDEVLVRASVVDGMRRPAPIAPGIPQHAVDQVLVLDYGSPESLELLRVHAHELAAVLIEPVQSRRPDLQPREFLEEVRKITAASDTALIFDELITGFRTAPGGAQAWFGIEADLVTYGKIIGGGLPIGAICGKAKYLDALDGGTWQYGDDSSPETGMTFFAGTYVRHPLSIRAALTVLTLIKREGPALQDELSARTERFANELNGWFEREQVPMRVTWFRSMIYFVFQQEFKYASLLFFHLRLKGLHIWEGRPCFFSTAHSDEEIGYIADLFKESLLELRAADFIPQADTAPVRVGVAPDDVPAIPSEPFVPSNKPMEYSLYFFGNYDAAYREDKYALLQDAAKFADANGFTAAWLPERHFHAVGGFSPNSSLLACSLAAVTTHLQLRGGSVVLPLHHPVRVAEEWSVADNLSQGRVAISIATGWHPNDFVFAPEAFEDRRGICARNLEIIQKLWRGETVEMSTPHGDQLPVQLHPLPRQRELPIWATCIHRESYADAGRRGLNVLGYLMNQTVDELAEKIAAYREGRRAAGLDPAGGHVTTLLFTYLDESVEEAREVARGPLCGYLRSYLDNSQKKIEKQIGEMDVDREDIDYLTNRSCDDYFNGKSLVGTVESCAAVVKRLKEIGVDEIGCFIDFGVPSAQVMQSLGRVTELMQRTAPEEIDLPLPEAEQGLWLLCSMNDDAARAYRESTTLVLNGELDRDNLLRAAQAVVDRHGALRTTIQPDGRAQTLHARQDFELDFIDFSDLSKKQAQAEAEDTLERMENEDFPGMHGPFLNGCLFKIAPQRHLLTFFFHHVVGNGPSYWVFLEELATLYRAYAGQTDEQLPPPFPFEEFVAQRRAYETSPEKEEAERFWSEQMKNGVPALDLPFDHPLPPALTYAGSREEIVLGAELAAELKKIGAAQRCSLFMVLLSAYGVLLHRLAGQDDLVVGVPFDSPIRSESAGRNLFANTTNMLPLRSRLADDAAFPAYLGKMKELVLAASEHQDYFFGNLVGKLNLPRNPARSPLFNVVFNLETGDFHRSCGALEMVLETSHVPYRGPRSAAMFDLYLNAAERANGEILVQCDHNLALIEPETMRRWLGHYRALLRGIVAQPGQPVADLPLVEDDVPAAPALA